MLGNEMRYSGARIMALLFALTAIKTGFGDNSGETPVIEALRNSEFHPTDEKHKPVWDSDFHAPPAPTIDDYDYDTSYDDSDDVRQSNKNASVVPTEVSLSPGSLRFFRQLPNVTKEVGDSIRLRCEAVGDPPPTRYKWFVNEAPLIEQKNRVIIRKVKSNGILTSRLRILKLDVQDSGYYRCEAFNGQQKAETTGIIKAIMSKHGSQDPVPAIPNFQPPFPSVGGTG